MSPVPSAGRELHVELVEDLELLRDDWLGWGERTGNLFATWDWNSLWWQQMGRGRRLMVATVRDDAGALVGLLPVYLAIAAGPARVMRLLGHGQGDRLGPICLPADRARVSAILRAALRTRPWARALLLAEQLPAEEGWSALLGARPVSQEASPMLELTTRDWDEFLAGRSANFRQQVRAKERRLMRAHDVRYRLVENAEALPAALDTLFGLHGTRWADAGVPEFAHAQAFHRAFAARAQERDWLRLWLLELDGRPVAAWYGFRFGGADWYYQSGRDPAWDRQSVGAVLLAHTIRDCVEAGLPRYLLLRGDEAYKQRFATGDPGLETVAVGGGLAGRAAVAALGSMRRLPPARRRLIMRLLGAEGRASRAYRSPRMQIAVLEPAGHGGLLHYSVQLAEALAARGHAVDIIAPRGNELADRARHARMRAILPVPLRPTAPATTRAAYNRRRAGVALRLLRAWTRILWVTRPGRYDAVVHGADIGVPPIALATLLMSVVPGRPLLVRIAHNVRSFNRRGGDELFDPSPVGGALLRRLYPRFDLVLVHGERSRAEFEATWGPARLAVIPHGDERIFADGPPPPSPEERILFFGDWRKVKGLPVLMDAFDELARRRPEARLTVAGTPAPEDWDPELLRAWARGHDGRVEVIDRYVPIAEVAPLFARARVVVTPYLTGYQSGVIHLAATMARPVVTSDVGDLASAVSDRVTGRVVPPRDPVQLARALEEVVADPERAAEMGEAGRRAVLSGSSWEQVAARVEQELAPLLRARRGAAR